MQMTTDPRSGYADRVREAIALIQERDGLNDPALAKRLGVTKSAVGQWKKGTAVPNPQMAFLVADLAKVAPRWLVLGNVPKDFSILGSNVSRDLALMANKLMLLSPAGLDILKSVFVDNAVDDKVIEAHYPPVKKLSTKPRALPRKRISR
jgi:transcriptional regulator with XRE-family HTH domain